MNGPFYANQKVGQNLVSIGATQPASLVHLPRKQARPIIALRSLDYRLPLEDETFEL